MFSVESRFSVFLLCVGAFMAGTIVAPDGFNRELFSKTKVMTIHVSSTPSQDESKAALSFLIGKFAVASDYSLVNVFLAGDAVYLLQDTTLNSLVGVGTGVLKESYDAMVASGKVKFYVSGMSCKSRGITPAEFAAKNPGGSPVTFEMPSKLIDLIEQSNTVFYY